MSRLTHKGQINSASAAGVLVTLGIIFGDLGTSPLYVMRAILAGASTISESFIVGGLSCIFWTLTLQTTIKYIIITIRADNKGEGGIFALFALIRRKAKWAYVFAIIGGCTLLSDGIITPAITIVSAVEGLNMVSARLPVVPIALVIITGLFFYPEIRDERCRQVFWPDHVHLVFYAGNPGNDSNPLLPGNSESS